MVRESDEDLWKLSYYHGLLPREDVEEMLKNHGDFLVRKSEESAGQSRSFVLSVVGAQRKRHFIFRPDEKGRIYIDPRKTKRWNSIEEFVSCYLGTEESVCSATPGIVLRKGAPRRSWELAHADIQRGKVLGSGAFGVVRLGTFVSKGQPIQVAIKEASVEKCTKDQIKEFMNEARIMRRFQSENIIQFHGAAVGQEPLMIVMELATDGALKDYLQKHNKGTRRKMYMCWGAASGLAHVHSKQILHCDIAARNCLYSQKRVKIADFGLAYEGVSMKLDKNKRLPIKWLAPETIHDRLCSAKSDTWSYGVLCWEIFENGKPPFENIPNGVVVKKILDPNAQLLEFPAETPAPMAQLVQERIWDRDHMSRYSMDQILDWFEAQGRGVIAQQTQGSQVDEEPPRRRHHDSRTKKSLKSRRK